MITERFRVLVFGLRALRRKPDLDSLRTATSPDQLAKRALIPAARNLGIAASFLPLQLRTEATAAMLACRVLDAYEDLADRPQASTAVLTAMNYLNGNSDTLPPPLQTAATRDSESVDLALTERIHDIRELLSTLPFPSQERVAHMLLDVGNAMARNLDDPQARTAYGQNVLGRVTLYACSLVTENSHDMSSIGELAGCVGITAQLANDLRDNELALYGASNRKELTQSIMLRLLAPALGCFALLAKLGTQTPSRGARAAMAYMTITTAAFLCKAADAPPPYPKRLQLGAALLAASSSARWTAMLKQTQLTADRAIQHLLNASPHQSIASPDTKVLSSSNFHSREFSTEESTVEPLIINATFDLVRALPEEPLTNELPEYQVRRMMIADHLAFGALERLNPCDADAMHSLAQQFQLAALDTPTQGGR
ncbi:MAG: squalene/phytoene synthase family protein [Mycobacteriaceae bacterium]